MIYITGDTHADFSRFNEDKFPIQSEMPTKEEMENGINNLRKVYFKLKVSL